MSRCTICGFSIDGGPNRVGGADVCDPCLHGDAPARIRERGWHFQVRQFEVVKNKEGDRDYVTEASLTLPRATQVQLKCRRKTMLWRLIGIAAPGLRCGDELFDKHVYARSSTPNTAEMLLRDDGVQSILLDMLGEGSWIAMDCGTVQVYSRRPEYVPEPRFSSEMCVLGSHIERLDE